MAKKDNGANHKINENTRPTISSGRIFLIYNIGPFFETQNA